MNDEEDEEILSIFTAEATATSNNHADDELFHETTTSTDEVKAPVTVDDVLNSPRRRRYSHKRASFQSHNRSESLPVTPRVPQVHFLINCTVINS